MKKKYLLKNIREAQFFDNIISEAAVKIDGAKVEANKEKCYFILTAPDAKFAECRDKLLKIIQKILPGCEASETDAPASYRKIVYLDHLESPSALEEIENIAKKTLNYEKISVDPASARFVIETTDLDLIANLEDELKKITASVDPNIVPRLQKAPKKELFKSTPSRSMRVKQIVSFAGLALFLIALLFQYVIFPYGMKIPGYDSNSLSNFRLWANIVLVAVFAASYVLLSYDLVIHAFKNFKQGKFFDEKFLMVLATVLAFGIGSFMEAVLVLIFYKLGEFLQDYAVGKSRSSINDLINIKPETATIILNESEVVVDPSEVRPNDLIIVKPGEKIPLDGIILSGEASLDTSVLTGESKFTEVKAKDKVMSGAIDIDGYLKIKVTHLYSESMVAKVIDLVSKARLNKSKTENTVDKFARYYTPIVCFLALVIIVLNFLFFQKKLLPNVYRYIHGSVYPAMIFLIVSCPCAIVLSVPLSFFGGIGASSKSGILVKGSNFLEDLSNVGLVIFDKTGTLTKGQFAVEEVRSASGSKAQVLRYAAYCEAGSIHPVAKSIVDAYGYKNIDFDKIAYVPSPSKKGNIIRLDGEEVIVGNAQFMRERKIKIPMTKTSGLVVYVVVSGKYCGHIVLKDELRSESKKTVSDLKRAGLDVVMVTGDDEEISRDIANQVGIAKVYANMTPLDKVKRVSKLKKHYPHQKVVFVGDGINDAPALTSADVGIAMGGFGSDAAIGVADVVLMTDDLSKLIEVLGIAKKVKKIVVQNIIFTMIVKIIVLTSATLFPSFTKMWESIFADVGVSLIAVINSMRTMNISSKTIFRLLFAQR